MSDIFIHAIPSSDIQVKVGCTANFIIDSMGYFV